MRNLVLGLSLLLGSGLLLTACGDSGSSCPSGQVVCDGTCIDAIDPTLSSIQSGVFTGSCAFSSCHDDSSSAGDLDLSSVSASGLNLVDVNSVQVPESLRVAPGDAGASYLMNKLLGVDMAAGTTQMPQSSPQVVLCAPKLEAIREWIADGAATN